MLISACRRRLRCAPTLGLAALRHSSTAQAVRKPPPANSASTSESAISEDDRPAKALTGTELAVYWDTFAPNHKQIAHAEAFFRDPPTAELLTTTPTFLKLPRAPVPEVVFLGRSNVGKSSLLNALLGVKDLCRTSRRPGFTKSMNMYLVGRDQYGFNPRKREPFPSRNKDESSAEEGVEEKRKMTKRDWEQKKMVELLSKQSDRAAQAKLVVMDMPGYGHASRGEWGVQIEKYLRGRRELKRAFLLINAEYGVKQSDLEMLEILRDCQIPHQIVLSKVDTLLPKVKSEKALRQSHVAELRAKLEERAQILRPIIQPPPSEGIPALGELLAVSATSEPKSPYRVLGVPENRYYLGIGALRWAVLSAAGLENVKNS